MVRNSGDVTRKPGGRMNAPRTKGKY